MWQPNFNQPCCIWRQWGPKQLILTSMVAACRPMPVWSCLKTSMTHWGSPVLSRPCCRTRAMRVASTLLQKTLKQRVFYIAAGYGDANDANTLRDDPIFKLMLDRLPESGASLASQPTISRFENRV